GRRIGCCARRDARPRGVRATCSRAARCAPCGGEVRMKRLAPIVLALAVCGAGTVDVARASELATIVGDVRDAGGTGLDGTIVTAKHIEATRETTVYGDASGHFTLRDLPPGTYHVHA